MIENEIWKPVVGYEGEFEVSNLGRVRRLYNKGLDGWRVLKATQHKSTRNPKQRYAVVSLSWLGARATGKRYQKGNYIPGSYEQRKVHILVLEAFVGPRPAGMQGCHNDGNSFNNRLDNLRWDTWEANCADKVKHGSHKGEKASRAILTEANVIEIRRKVKSGYYTGLFRDLGDFYGLSHQNIRMAAYGVTWSHLNDIEPPASRNDTTKGFYSHSLLNSEQVRDIKSALISGKRGIQRALARKYGVDPTTINSIAKGKTWLEVK